MKIRSSGFTITELMLAVSTAALVTTFAVPSIQVAVQNNQTTAQVNELVGQLAAARGEAVSRGHTVSLCTSSDEHSCNADGRWEDGYIVFLNLDGDSPPAVDPGEDVLRVVRGMAPAYTLRSAELGAAVSFGATSYPSAPGTFTFCDERGAAAARGVVLSAVGRARATVDADADGVHEGLRGAGLSCPGTSG
jgi:type IV fimbrial biogenesis protein FimT